VTWFRGRAAILDFLPRGPLSAPRRFVPVRANGQLAFGTYILDAERGDYRANAIHLIDLRADEIVGMTAFLDQRLFPSWGLPLRLPAR
jgi:RNA polymerase sigma-70 factor (ECF subfamily)